MLLQQALTARSLELGTSPNTWSPPHVCGSPPDSCGSPHVFGSSCLMFVGPLLMFVFGSPPDVFGSTSHVCGSPPDVFGSTPRVGGSPHLLCLMTKGSLGLRSDQQDNQSLYCKWFLGCFCSQDWVVVHPPCWPVFFHMALNSGDPEPLAAMLAHASTMLNVEFFGRWDVLPLHCCSSHPSGTGWSEFHLSKECCFITELASDVLWTYCIYFYFFPPLNCRSGSLKIK